MRSFFAALCLSLAAAAAGSAQTSSVRLSGVVRDAAGEPVPHASVSVEAGSSRLDGLTNDEGRFRLGPVTASRYVLRVEALGYVGVTRQLSAAEAATPFEIVLERSPLALASVEVQADRRTGVSAATLPVKVDVVRGEELAVQRALAANPTELLSNVIPSFSPSRQKLTSAGESLRGRRPLFLVDGVPQSNPLRDGRRDAFTIDMEMIERVEVVFGANAIQGLGATGGIVNYVTVRPSLTGALTQRASLTATSDDSFDGDGLGWRASYLAAKRLGGFDVLGSISYEERGLQYDGEGRAIGVDNVQGDIADSRSWNVVAKAGWEPAAGQRLQLTVNDFRLEQNGEFDIVAGDRASGLPTTSAPGAPEGIEPINDVTMLSLDYENQGFAGGVLSAKGYWQDFSALFGGGRFATFQDPRIAPVGELFDQSQNNSEKYGTRLTYAASRVAAQPVNVITGVDFHRDRTFQRLVHTDRNWVPETEFLNYAPFVQLDVEAVRWLTLSGGLRWEIAQLDVPTFEPLAANRPDYETITVEGGSPSFNEPLWNIGAVLTPVPALRLYGTFSQAYTMPDVGRVLRGISEPGTSVDDFLALEPIETDNAEIGGAFGMARGELSVSYFRSESEYGSRLVPNADGIFQVLREPTRTSGWEVATRFDAHPRVSVGAAYSLLDGSYDGDGDGELESDLGAADVGPDRLNLSIDLNRGGRVRGRLQSFTFFDERFHDGDGAETARFDGYTTVDGSLGFEVTGATRLTLSISNLLDEQYITYYGQAATTLNDRYFAGRGRTLSLRFETAF